MFQRLSLRTFGRPQTLPGRVRLPLAAGFGTMGCFLPAFNPDVWPPSNASRRGTVATGSARGLKTWLFTVRAGFGTLGCVLTAFTPDVWPPSNPPRQGTAAAGCRLWHNGLFFLPAFNPDVWPPSNPPRQGIVVLHPSATASAKGLRKLDFTLFRQALAQWAVFYPLPIQTFGRPQTFADGCQCLC